MISTLMILMSLMLNPFPIVAIKGRERLIVTILVMGEAFCLRRSMPTIRTRLVLRVMMIVMILHLRRSIISPRRK